MSAPGGGVNNEHVAADVSASMHRVSALNSRNQDPNALDMRRGQHVESWASTAQRIRRGARQPIEASARIVELMCSTNTRIFQRRFCRNRRHLEVEPVQQVQAQAQGHLHWAPAWLALANPCSMPGIVIGAASATSR